MNSKWPQPSEILEELADKVIEQIEKLGVTGFETSLNELIEYHRFLLDAYSTVPDDGEPFSYAEIEDWLERSFQKWMREYSRLFERAAERLGQEPEFLSTLAYVAIRLLPEDATVRSSRTTVELLDLGVIFAHRLEAWVTRHSALSDLPAAASPHMVLTGSDQRAYENVLVGFVGAWESALTRAGLIYKWKETRAHTPPLQWRRLAASWLFIARHLKNTAHLLATAVWNEDGTGALRFRDALIRWPATIEFEFAQDNQAYLERPMAVLPELLASDWPEAQRQFSKVGGFPAEATPFAILRVVLTGAHADIVLLTAGVLCRWYMEEKQSSDLAIETASKLLKQEQIEVDELGDPVAPGSFNFRSLFMRLIRLETSGERYDESKYGTYLDGVASYLDGMTERRVVPGRVFTPSTIQSRHDLLGPFLGMLLATMPLNGDDGVVAAVTSLASDDALLPMGDASLREVLHLFQTMISAVDTAADPIERVAVALAPKNAHKASLALLRAKIEEAETAVKTARGLRIGNLPFDTQKIQKITSEAADAMVTAPAGIEVFSGFHIGSEKHTEAPTRILNLRGMRKGEFTEPRMESESVELEKFIAGGVRDFTASLVWQAFWKRERINFPQAEDPARPAFWLQVAELSANLQSPIILVGSTRVSEMLFEWAHTLPKRPPEITLRTKQTADRPKGRYIITIEGIDAYFRPHAPAAVALFSGTSLKQVVYSPVDESGVILKLDMVPEESPWNVTLSFQVRQRVEWDDSPIFTLPPPDDDRPAPS